MAIDTSAIVAVARGEPEAAAFSRALASRNCLIGAPTAQEAHMVLVGDDGRWSDFLDALLARRNAAVVPFDAAHLAAARDAFGRYGRRRHAAALNYGDCLAYSVAKVADAPLLFKGGDLALTDLRPAYVPPTPAAPPA